MTPSFVSTTARMLLMLVSVGAGSGLAGAAPKTKTPLDANTAAVEAAPDVDACVLAYKASLGRIAETDLPLIRSANAAAAAAVDPANGTPTMPSPAASSDPALPGRPLFVSPSRPRSPAEIAAMTAAVALARSRGASTTIAGGSGADRTWTAARLQEDLGDYLRQKPAPFLCSGVDAYVGTLRRAATRLGPADDQRAAWIATLRTSAERSVKAAEQAIKLSKPALAKADAARSELRPATGNARSDAPPAVSSLALDGEAEILAAIDGLMKQTREAGLVAEPPVPATTGATAVPAVLPRPVLAKLDGLKPLVSSSRPLVRDQPVRLKLVGAFADLEMLDYLMKAPSPAADPVAAAIGRTLSAIEAAHKSDCTCGN